MSAFHNGALRTMKANYTIRDENYDIRVIRPLAYTREKLMKKFAGDNSLPVISDNCPACFASPKERHRIKVLLAKEEFQFHDLFSCLAKAMKPLMAVAHARLEDDEFVGDKPGAIGAGKRGELQRQRLAERAGGGCSGGNGGAGGEQVDAGEEDALAELAMTQCGIDGCKRERKEGAGGGVVGEDEERAAIERVLLAVEEL